MKVFVARDVPRKNPDGIGLLRNIQRVAISILQFPSYYDVTLVGILPSYEGKFVLKKSSIRELNFRVYTWSFGSRFIQNRF